MPGLLEDLTAAGLDPKVAEEISKNEKVAPVLNTWREGGLRQSDYDRKMNLGKAELSAAQQRVAEQAAALETERTRMNSQFLEAQQAREASDMLNAQMLAKAKTASAVYGVDLVKELVGDAKVEPTARKESVAAAPGNGNGDLNKRLDDLEGTTRWIEPWVEPGIDSQPDYIKEKIAGNAGEGQPNQTDQQNAFFP